MDRAASKENEKSLWSSCSVEDFTNTMKSYPECLTPVSSANLPPTDTPALTDSECKMPSSLANLNGVHSLKLNGKNGFENLSLNSTLTVIGHVRKITLGT